MPKKEDCLYECRVGRIQADITTFWMLSRMCWIGTKLYNTAMWHARDTWDKTGKIPTGYDLHKIVQASYFHQFLHTHTSQKCADVVGQSFRSWYALRKEDPTAHPPGFRKKADLSTICFTQFGFHILPDGNISLSVGKKLRDELQYPKKYLPLKIDWNTALPQHGEIQQLEIVPREEGWFELHAKIKMPVPVWRQDGQVGCIDYGGKVPIAATFEDGQQHLFMGGAMHEQLHYLNKTKGQMQNSIMKKTKDKQKWTTAIGNLNDRVNGQKDHALHALADQFVQQCVQSDVKTVVGGKLKGIKKEKQTGKGKNWRKPAKQNWQQFPIRKLAGLVRYKLARHCIQYIEDDERGTSRGRCSICGCTDRKKLHRLKRGMFWCENCDTVQHADLNGSGNGLAKYLHHGVLVGAPTGSSGRLARPSVWRWDYHLWKVVS